jgi:thiosulfate/3-mercaptopyruvate sulfurtransferase
MTFTNPRYLVQPDELEVQLGDPALRILDCTVFLRPAAQPGGPFVIESGRERWAASHIPGAGFADLQDDLSDRTTRLRFMMPPAEQFAAAMSSYGVDDATRVVLYDGNMSMWAARIWWMLRAFGFDNAAVLDGGMRRWKREGRPLTDVVTPRPAGRFVARPRPDLIASKDEVQAAIANGSTCIVNALAAEQHAGTVAPYGRAGHIPSSVNVPAMAIIDPETHAYLQAEELRSAFAAKGALAAPRVVTYCGGGIAASSDAFVLTLLGHENVAVYDGSLSEWAADPSLPMEVG